MSDNEDVLYTISPLTPTISQFEFHSGKEWILRITREGIIFNHESWPQSLPSDFAQAFCDVLEKGYEVNFTKRSKTQLELWDN